MPTLLAAGKYKPLPVTLEPVGISFAAVAVPVVAKLVPSKVKPAESVSRPPVVENTTRPDVRPVLVMEVDAVIAFAAKVVFATVSVPVAAPMFSVVAAPKALTVVLTVLNTAIVASPMTDVESVRLPPNVAFAPFQ